MKIKAQKREITGKKVKNLRNAGEVPAAVFGPKMESVNIKVDSKEFDTIFKKAGYNKFIDLEVEGGKSMKVLVKNASMHPVKDHYIDISFYAVDEDRKLTVDVPVILEGVAPAVKQNLGFLVQQMDSIAVHCLPKDLPGPFTISVTGLMDVGESVAISTIELPEGVEWDSSVDEHSAIAYIAGAQKEIVEEEPETEEGEEGEEGEEKEGEEGEEDSEEKSEE